MVVNLRSALPRQTTPLDTIDRSINHVFNSLLIITTILLMHAQRALLVGWHLAEYYFH